MSCALQDRVEPQVALQLEHHQDPVTIGVHHAKIIDAEVKKIIDECYQKAKKLLSDNEEKLKALAEKLLEKEVLGETEVKATIGILKEKSDAAVADS